MNNNAGVIYFSNMSKITYKTLLPCTISSEGLKIQPTIKQRHNVLNGIKIDDVVKSHKSKTVLPKILKSLIKPKDKEQGITRNAVIIETTTVAICLDIL